MVADHNYRLFSTARYYVDLIPHTVHAAIRLPFESAASLYDHFRDRKQLEEENKELNRLNAAMTFSIRALTGIEKQNRRLKGLLKTLPLTESHKYRVAEIVRVINTASKHRLIINKGAQDGISVGQPILNAEGILGHIVSVTPLTATGIMVTDPSYSLQVRLERSGLMALARGKGVPNQFALRYVPAGADIKQGDFVVSSGLDGLYPPDYLIGRVIDVVAQTPVGSFSQVILEPIAATNYSREVLVLELAGVYESLPQ